MGGAVWQCGGKLTVTFLCFYGDYLVLTIIADCRDTCPDFIGEFSAFLRLKAWLTWFLEYAEKVMTGLAAAYDTVLSVPGNLTPAERLVYFVRLVANSGFWVQHRSALRIRTDSGML